MKNRNAKHLKLPILPSLSLGMKPRNPLAVAAAKRKAGSHEKSAKALRRAERVKIKQMQVE